MYLIFCDEYDTKTARFELIVKEFLSRDSVIDFINSGTYSRSPLIYKLENNKLIKIEYTIGAILK